MRRRWVGLALAAALLAGCGDTGSSGTTAARAETTLLEFVNLLLDSAPFQVFRNTVPIRPLVGHADTLGVGERSAWLEANPGTATFSGGAGGTEYFSEPVTLTAGQTYSLRLIGWASPPAGEAGPRLLTLRIDDTETATGIGLRFTHAIAGVGPLDLVFRPLNAAEVVVAANVAFGETTPLVDGVATLAPLTNGVGSLLLRRSDTGETLLSEGVTINGGVNVAAMGAAGDVQLVLWRAGAPEPQPAE